MRSSASSQARPTLPNAKKRRPKSCRKVISHCSVLISWLTLSSSELRLHRHMQRGPNQPVLYNRWNPDVPKRHFEIWVRQWRFRILAPHLELAQQQLRFHLPQQDLHVQLHFGRWNVDCFGHLWGHSVELDTLDNNLLCQWHQLLWGWDFENIQSFFIYQFTGEEGQGSTNSMTNHGSMEDGMQDYSDMENPSTAATKTTTMDHQDNMPNHGDMTNHGDMSDHNDDMSDHGNMMDHSKWCKIFINSSNRPKLKKAIKYHLALTIMWMWSSRPCKIVQIWRRRYQLGLFKNLTPSLLETTKAQPWFNLLSTFKGQNSYLSFVPLWQ